MGNKEYELSNHLGNVLSTLSDRKLAVPDPDSLQNVGYYAPQIITAQDYYSFGMMMPDRHYSINDTLVPRTDTVADIPCDDHFEEGIGGWVTTGPFATVSWDTANARLKFDANAMWADNAIKAVDVIPWKVYSISFDVDLPDDSAIMLRVFNPLGGIITYHYIYRGESMPTTRNIYNSGYDNITIMFTKCVNQLVNSSFFIDDVVMTGDSITDTNLIRVPLESYRFGFNGQEKDDEIAGNGNVYTAMFWEYDSRIARRWNPDPVDKPWMSPYHAFSNKPIINIDPNGALDNPIYDINTSEFLGTDDKGIQGEAIMMNKSDFTQGMSHSEAMSKGKTLNSMSDAEATKFCNNGNFNKFLNHYNSLRSRPDWDGFITISEGIEWAKTHPGSLAGTMIPSLFNPDDALYADASKLDFGALYKSNFKRMGEIEPQNLLNKSNMLSALTDEKIRATVYALGAVDMILLNENGDVRIVNNEATVYDWNGKGGVLRNTLINLELLRAGLKQGVHGFKVFYYGTGRLRAEPIPPPKTYNSGLNRTFQ